MMLRERGILSLNSIFRKYTPQQIEKAISDYDECLTDGVDPRNPTAFFTWLLR
jgi:hypothetical protein